MAVWTVTAVLCSLTAVICDVSAQSPVVVTTQYGAVQGLRTPIGTNSYVDKFFTIPYSKPPVGNLRFSPPQFPMPWNGTRDATRPGSMCPQQPDSYLLPSQMFPQDEDCLYLNVYRPKVSGPGTRLPVMVWIHGGGYRMGSGYRFDWTHLAAQGVLVVTFNYRLDALGFLSTEDNIIPGNYGLMDQVLALHWVRDGIDRFNGDPGKVTLFGESAGSSSVSLLLQAGPAKGLFHRAIMESGVSLSGFAVGYPEFSPSPRQQALDLGRRLGCDVNQTSRFLDCLRTRSRTATIIRDVSGDMQKTAGLIFRPVPEATFGQTGVLTATPASTLLQDGFSHVPTMRGFNSDESAIFLPDDRSDEMTMEEFRHSLQYLIQATSSHVSPHPVDVQVAITRLMDAYIIIPNITDPRKILQASIQLQSDFTFAGPTLLELQLTSQRQVLPQYLYRFAYRSAQRLNPAWKGVQHVDEIPYVSGAPVDDIMVLKNFVSNWTQEDVRVSHDVMTLWANFAKYGNPTPSPVSGATWLPWTQNHHGLLEIGNTLHMRGDPITPQRAVIMSILSEMYGLDRKTIIG